MHVAENRALNTANLRHNPVCPSQTHAPYDGMMAESLDRTPGAHLACWKFLTGESIRCMVSEALRYIAASGPTAGL
jgi:hypothetical protein